MAIQSFSDKNTEEFFTTGSFQKGIGWANVSQIAKRKFDMIHYTAQIDDLRAPLNHSLIRRKSQFQYRIKILKLRMNFS